MNLASFLAVLGAFAFAASCASLWHGYERSGVSLFTASAFLLAFAAGLAG